ncbi:hypothetical protein GF412_03885 [Candidatus Micrarchaeota archaeon]|nr:hypothetical protein [Candidatus Micrarchaeota archaeon]MBD3418090.1 hypothetical protein [Candidatus Micrarchaeota archaeon]
MIRGPRAIRARYADTRIAKRQDGKRVMVNLPERRDGEAREIKRILSSYHCRSCAKCCSGGFSIGKEEEHYAYIMRLLRKKKKHFIVEKMRARNKAVYYDIGVPRNRNACGFLSWEGGTITHRTLILSDGRDREWKPFSCGIYDARATVCLAYPISMAWMRLALKGGEGEREGTAILDIGCPAIEEMAELGIGHLTECEIISLSVGTDVGMGSLLGSFPTSINTVNKKMEEIGKENRILVNGKGERVYPVNAWELFL